MRHSNNRNANVVMSPSIIYTVHLVITSITAIVNADYTTFKIETITSIRPSKFSPRNNCPRIPLSPTSFLILIRSQHRNTKFWKTSAGWPERRRATQLMPERAKLRLDRRHQHTRGRSFARVEIRGGVRGRTHGRRGHSHSLRNHTDVLPLPRSVDQLAYTDSAAAERVRRRDLLHVQTNV